MVALSVYHITNFDVSAVQLQLTANVFNVNTIEADYWVGIELDLNYDSNNNYQMRDDNNLNSMFKDISQIVSSPVFSTGGDRTKGFDDLVENDMLAYPDISFKDLGIIDRNTDTLLSNVIYNIGNLNQSDPNTYPDSFIGKIQTILSAKPDVVDIRRKMIATINYHENSDLGINDEMPIGATFGFLIVRNLNIHLLGPNQNQTAHIGVVFRQVEI